MRILAFDQATHFTGCALMDDGKLVWSKVIDLDKVRPSWIRIREMYLAIAEVLDNTKFDTVYFEATEFIKNIDGMIMLSELKGMCIAHCYDKGYDVGISEPAKWRGILGFLDGEKSPKKPALKAKAVQYVSDTYGIECSDDEAEAICIADAMSKAQ